MSSAAVVGVGDELLSGLVVNSNAAMIGQALLDAGVPVTRSECVGDIEDEIVEVLDRACRGADVVIVTGGLGPTADDRTREALARLLGTRLVRDDAVVEDIRARFKAFGRVMPEANAKQADVPEGARAIPNPYGTAPGIRAEIHDAVLYAIPGVPGEARHMVDDQILPELQDAGIASPIRTRTLLTVGLPESELADRFTDLAVADNPRMAFLPGGGEIRLRFVARGPDASGCETELDRCEATVRERVGEFVFGMEGDTLEGVVGARLTERGLTVATAESCTAGLLSSRLADVPGASAFLRGGVVAYANEIKAEQLGIDPAFIEQHGPVSEQVTTQMATAVRERFGADCALAITCAAGPDPQQGAEPGTTVLAMAGLGDAVEVRSARLPGDRAQVRRFATTFALNMLRLHLT